MTLTQKQAVFEKAEAELRMARSICDGLEAELRRAEVEYIRARGKRTEALAALFKIEVIDEVMEEVK